MLLPAAIYASGEAARIGSSAPRGLVDHEAGVIGERSDDFGGLPMGRDWAAALGSLGR
jgi:hypothetical protein